MYLLDQDIKNIIGKHIKQTLFKLEIIFGANLPLDIRKIILDEMNDVYRDIAEKGIIYEKDAC